MLSVGRAGSLWPVVCILTSDTDVILNPWQQMCRAAVAAESLSEKDVILYVICGSGSAEISRSSF